MITKHRPLEILLVEDSCSDAKLIAKMFSLADLPHNLRIIDDGVKAISFLYQKGKYYKMPRPDIILLDLNLPKKNGLAVLAQIQSEPSLRNIPVIILTASASEQDIRECYRMNANCYLTKPSTPEDFCRTIKIIEDFWFNVAKIPYN
ncbi:MAG: response regulator [Xenococcaceae cyanobacterium MO_167.B27]|nr:response regulator [Xenococcaceae cyanobacterium MO_167.B27]